MTVHPLRPATDRRLGEPLPHQPANQTRDHLLPINLWHLHHAMMMHYEVLIEVSLGCPSVKGRFPTCYSPVRRFPSLQSTEVSISDFSLDLHVLSTPPAFILSQDQTLNENCMLSLSAYHLFQLSKIVSDANVCLPLLLCLGILGIYVCT